MPGTAGYRVWGRGKGLEEESGGEEWRGTLKLGMSGQTIPEEDDDDDLFKELGLDKPTK